MLFLKLSDLLSVLSRPISSLFIPNALSFSAKRSALFSAESARCRSLIFSCRSFFGRFRLSPLVFGTETLIAGRELRRAVVEQYLAGGRVLKDQSLSLRGHTHLRKCQEAIGVGRCLAGAVAPSPPEAQLKLLTNPVSRGYRIYGEICGNPQTRIKGGVSRQILEMGLGPFGKSGFLSRNFLSGTQLYGIDKFYFS